MLLKKSSIVYQQVDPGNNGGGGSNAQAAPQVPPPAPSAPAPQAPGTIEFDQFGYPKTQAAPPAPAASQIPQATQQTPATPPAPEVNSGYNTPPPPPNTAGYVDPNAQPPAPPPPGATTPPSADAPPAHELVDMKDLPEADKKTFGEYFTKHKIPKEAQQGLVDIVKAEMAAATQLQTQRQKDLEAQVNKTKSDWFNELRNDKDFGGANFDANIKTVNKFINDFMPNTKKMLTEKGGMLPPSTMRDFYSVAKRLFETEKFVQGDGSGASETKQPDNWKFLSELYPNNG